MPAADSVHRTERRRVVRNGVVMGAATGAYGLTFGALGVAAGLSILQTCVLSLVMFTGGSQFAFVGVVAGGGSPLAGAAAATLLGARNMLYGLTVGPLLRVRGARKLAASQLVIDESTAMAMGETGKRLQLTAFWSTGIGIFVFWNASTLIGAVAAGALPDPRALGLDAVAPAAFVFLFAPRLRTAQAWIAAAVGAVVALGVVPLVPPGLPVIVAAVAVAGYALLARVGAPSTPHAATDPDPMTEGEPGHDAHGVIRSHGDRSHDVPQSDGPEGAPGGGSTDVPQSDGPDGAPGGGR
ncbi:AzlC family ABC transporter permease [Cumulibacter manganitolerans]|uniref:AzlC family ABC transporter permease n=1 Tax=Cumulibacter manganitolerans TaxID=1884992 RepID=UPI001E4FDFFF|nr:AzlC family ABC transporter permease [Cumulibacter manganitolerans]